MFDFYPLFILKDYFNSHPWNEEIVESTGRNINNISNFWKRMFSSTNLLHKELSYEPNKHNNNILIVDTYQFHNTKLLNRNYIYNKFIMDKQK